MRGDEPVRWGWTPAAWGAAVETEVRRSTLEQGLPVEVEDEAVLSRVASLLAEGSCAFDRLDAAVRA